MVHHLILIKILLTDYFHHTKFDYTENIGFVKKRSAIVLSQSTKIQYTTRWICVTGAVHGRLNVVMSSFGIPVPAGICISTT